MVLQKLTIRAPLEGITGEIHYWRDVSKILQELRSEVKQNFVEVTLQVLINSQSDMVQESIEYFGQLKSKILKNASEAKHNNNIMK